MKLEELHNIPIGTLLRQCTDDTLDVEIGNVWRVTKRISYEVIAVINIRNNTSGTIESFNHYVFKVLSIPIEDIKYTDKSRLELVEEEL